MHRTAAEALRQHGSFKGDIDVDLEVEADVDIDS